MEVWMVMMIETEIGGVNDSSNNVSLPYATYILKSHVSADLYLL